jgi:methylmalonyl-CoA mutase N-terminal domain/subunit
MEREAEELFARIAEEGGVVRGLEDGWFQKRIAESAARQQWEIEQRRKLVVGVNEFVTDETLTIPLLKLDEAAAEEQTARLRTLRTTRDNALVQQRLDALRTAARGTENLVPYILECARAYATLYEIRASLEDVFGAYREPVFF